MAFVNEFASEEDVEKFDLNGIWDKFKPHRQGHHYEFGPPIFTIDRDRNIFYMGVGQGREEHFNRRRSLLWIDGNHVVVDTDLIDKPSDNPEGLRSNPYRITWELVSISAAYSVTQSAKEIISLLKEAMIVYGYRGAHKQLDNTLVEFTF